MQAKKRSINYKVIVLLSAVTLAVGGAISGSIAWLVDSTNNVKSTFMVGNVNIILGDENDTAATYSLRDGGEGDDAFYIVPGASITIDDPTVTVSANSEDCYLFVKIDEYMGALPYENGQVFTDYLYYEMDPDEWTAGTGEDEDGNGVPVGVYYRIVERSEEDQVFTILAVDEDGHNVTVSGDLTKTDLDTIAANEDYPELIFWAYAVQYHSANNENFSPAEAWEMIPATAE